jgi:hypothetical protein
VQWRRIDPREAARLMRDYGRPWWIGGGWAVDLFVGRETREHTDLDVVIFRSDQEHAFGYFEGWDLQVAHDGKLTPWHGEPLELPVHTLWARSSPDVPWELELFLMESDEERWRFRRDLRVTLPLDLVGLERDGIPYLAPELALLYKAKAPRARATRRTSTLWRRTCPPSAASGSRRRCGVRTPGTRGWAGSRQRRVRERVGKWHTIGTVASPTRHTWRDRLAPTGREVGFPS